MGSDSAPVGRGGVGVRRPADGGAGPSVGMWLTTADRTSLLRPCAALRFRRRSGGGPDGDRATIAVEPSRTGQSLLGCGASITDSSAALLYRMSAERREEVMRRLFSPAFGIGLSYLRQPVGSSAFVDGPRYYTYDDVPDGETDFGLARFSIGHDEARILPLLRHARRYNPQLKVMGTPWSAPAWMKTNGSLVGGELIDAERYYEAYAEYLVRFIAAYERAGVPVDALTLQNEPQNRNPDIPGMHLGVAQAKKLIQALGPALRRAGLATRVVAFDHNWAIHPDDVASTPPGQDPEKDYPFDILADPDTARWVSGTAFHCYYGDPEAQSRLHDAHPDKDVYFTECSGSRGPADSDAKAFSDTLRWHARNVVIGATRHWSRTAITWNLALDPSGGPHASGFTDFSGVVTVEDDDTYTLNAEYYALGHLSRFTRPGAVRIETTCGDGVASVAFRGEDGTIALLAHNESDQTQTIDVTWEGYGAECVLPGGSLATFTWEDAGSGYPATRA